MLGKLTHVAIRSLNMPFLRSLDLPVHKAHIDVRPVGPGKYQVEAKIENDTSLDLTHTSWLRWLNNGRSETNKLETICPNRSSVSIHGISARVIHHSLIWLTIRNSHFFSVNPMVTSNLNRVYYGHSCHPVLWLEHPVSVLSPDSVLLDGSILWLPKGCSIVPTSAVVLHHYADNLVLFDNSMLFRRNGGRLIGPITF